MFKIIILFLSLNSAMAINCPSLSRAVVSDQKNISYDLAFGYLQINPAYLIELGTSKYVSWRGELNSCLVDINHYTKFDITYKSGLEGKRCRVSIDAYVLDHFSTTGQREIKPRNVVQECYDENQQEREQSQKCAQAKACSVSKKGMYVQDYNNNCECVLIDELIDYENLVEEYENFYNSEFNFEKPSDILDIFNN